jgi:predicted oxidoreductase
MNKVTYEEREKIYKEALETFGVNCQLVVTLEELSEVYGADKTALAAAWILRHPAGMQVIAGTTNPDRLASVCKGAELDLRREDWYRLYKAAGNHLP